MSDGGGVKQALPRPVVGADKVTSLFALMLNTIGANLSVEPAQINGSPGLFLLIDGGLDMVVALRVEGGLITGLYSVRNPEELSGVQREASVSR